jgi:cell division protein FtsB
VNWLQKFGEQLVQWRRLLASAVLVSLAVIEKEAREQLRYAKPGEVIYLLPEKTGPQPSQPPESAKK